MTATQVKVALRAWSNDIITAWFGTNSLTDIMIRPAVQAAIDINIDKIDALLSIFTDIDGNVAVDKLIGKYIELIPEEGIILPLKDYLGDNFITRAISPKLLERSDLVKLKELLTNGN